MALSVFIQRCFLVLFFAFNAVFSFAQKAKEPIELTAGVELRALIPVSFFTEDSIVLTEVDNNFRSVYSYKGGFGFGGVVRVKFTDFWNLETGIYYTRRNYDISISDPLANYEAQTTMSIIGYEIPVKGLIYIQMGKSIFMNVSLGVSADFFASDTEVQELNYNVVSFKKSWAKMAVLGNLGVEYRTKESGYFYLGASFHQPFGDIMGTQVNYKRDKIGLTYFQNGNIDGTYFSVDMRYFFPPQKSKKTKVNRVIPDWKNMR